MAGTFAPVSPEDFSVEPFEVSKRFLFTTSSYQSRGIQIKQGLHYKGNIHISSSRATPYPTNSDGSYKYLVHKSLYQLYYRGYSFFDTHEGHDRNNVYKNFFITSSLMSIPHYTIGDKIKESSVILKNIDENIELRDDRYGNLYDYNINTSSFLDSRNLVIHWGFEDNYKYFKYGRGTRSGDVVYNSNVFEPYENSKGINISYDVGIPINNTGSGLAASFSGDSYLYTRALNEYSFEKSEDFTISFWLKGPKSQSKVDTPYNCILDKKTYKYTQQLVNTKKIKESGAYVNSIYISSSAIYDPVDFYPYDFRVHNYTHEYPGRLSFRRADGFGVLEITSSYDVLDGNYHHIALVKTGSDLNLYVDGNLDGSKSDLGRDSVNFHDILIGSGDFQFSEGFSGSLDEIRIYDNSFSESHIATLADSSSLSVYQTSKVGNVFYRSGNIVLTSFDTKYHRIVSSNFSLQFDNVVRMYEYEVLCRIKAGDFNLTLNPSAAKNVKSYEYLDSFTGSLSPYITTIGLYNENNELLAVGKLGQPIKKRDDVTLNIIVKWDH